MILRQFLFNNLLFISHLHQPVVLVNHLLNTNSHNHNSFINHHLQCLKLCHLKEVSHRQLSMQHNHPLPNSQLSRQCNNLLHSTQQEDNTASSLRKDSDNLSSLSNRRCNMASPSSTLQLKVTATLRKISLKLLKPIIQAVSDK